MLDGNLTASLTDVLSQSLWSAGLLAKMGARAVVTAELVSTGVELAVRDREVAQL
jgi:hypothetical protein